MGYRYELERHVGSGGFGTVWQARDRVAGTVVAVKMMALGRQKAGLRLRRELSAMRRLPIPGVVQLREDWTSDTTAYLVMDLVDGVPFPGGEGVRSWDELRPVVTLLLRTLHRVHRRGLVHADLKPANVLVDAAGLPHLLDLGLATGRPLTWSRDQAVLEATLLYGAPEQFLQGVPLDGRADQFNLGVMCHEALAGAPPWPLVDVFSARLSGAAPELDPRLGAWVPPDVVRFLERLLAVNPNARFEDCARALEAIGEVVPRLALGALDKLTWPADADALHTLFHGEVWFKRAPQRAAAVLWQRTGGRRSLVEAELEAWYDAALLIDRADGRFELAPFDLAALEAGVRVRSTVGAARSSLSPGARELLAVVRLACPDVPAQELGESAELEALRENGLVWDLGDGALGAEVAVSPFADLPGVDPSVVRGRALELLPRSSARRIELLGEGGEVAQGWVEDCVFVARRLTLAGKRLRAQGLLEAAVVVARDSGDLHAARLAVDHLVGSALGGDWGDEVRRALLVVEATARMDAHELALGQMLRAVAHLQARDAARAWEALAEVEAFDDPELDRWRRTVNFGCLALRDVAAARVEVAASAAWAHNDPGARACWLAWQARLCYQDGDFLEAARLHRASARLREDPVGRVVCLLNAAAASLEVHDPEVASSLAPAAYDIAVQIAHPDSAARASYLLRAARYRQGMESVPIPERTRAAAGVSAYLGAVHALLDAAEYWRAGAQGLLQQSASEGVAWAEQANNLPVAALIDALALGASARADASVVRSLAARAAQLPFVALRAQVLALIAHHLSDERLASLKEELTRGLPGRTEPRREVLSMTEVRLFLSRRARACDPIPPEGEPR